jgi:hypothetical protein
LDSPPLRQCSGVVNKASAVATRYRRFVHSEYSSSSSSPRLRSASRVPIDNISCSRWAIEKVVLRKCEVAPVAFTCKNPPFNQLVAKSNSPIELVECTRWVS